MKARRVINAVAGLFVFVTILYVSSCSVVAHRASSAFDSVRFGDDESSVVHKFDLSPRRETSITRFRRYATTFCVDPCVERLWFENRMSLDTQAWSVDLNANGFVIKKYYWTSP